MSSPHPDDTAKTDLLMMAYDDEFLFVVARCHKVAGHAYASNPAIRTRDPDLKHRDRLEFCLIRIETPSCIFD